MLFSKTLSVQTNYNYNHSFPMGARFFCTSSSSVLDTHTIPQGPLHRRTLHLHQAGNIKPLLPAAAAETGNTQHSRNPAEVLLAHPDFPV